MTLSQVAGLADLQQKFMSGALNLEDSSAEDEDNLSSSSSSSSSADEKAILKRNALNDLTKTGACSRLQLRTAFRAKIYQIAGPVGLVELNEDFKQLSQHGVLKAETLLSSFDKDFYNLDRQILKFKELPTLSRQLFE